MIVIRVLLVVKRAKERKKKKFKNEIPRLPKGEIYLHTNIVTFKSYFIVGHLLHNYTLQTHAKHIESLYYE